MRKTSDLTMVMKRLAEMMDWRIESSGRSWTVTKIPARYGDNVDLEGLTWKNTALIGFMLRVAMAPQKYKGLGLDPSAIAEAIKWDPPGMDRNGNQRLPSGLDATDEATFSRFFKRYWEVWMRQTDESQSPLDEE